MQQLAKRLSEISTVQHLLEQVHAQEKDQAIRAQQEMLSRYGNAIFRYLLAAVGDREEAADLCQEFALALVRGDFAKYDPRRGRFRSYLKSVLFHLVARHRLKKKRRRELFENHCRELQDRKTVAADNEEAFRRVWRDELLTRAMDRLAAVHPQSHRLMQFRIDNPKMRSPEMARRMSEAQGETVTSESVRQRLRRARRRLADLLVEEIQLCLNSCDLEAVANELRELNLLEYCKSSLDKLGG